MHEDQLSLQREFEKESERRKSLIKAKINDPKNHKIESAKLGKLGKKLNFLIKLKVVRYAVSAKQCLLLRYSKEALLSTNKLHPTLPKEVLSLLQEFEDISLKRYQVNYQLSEGSSIILISSLE